MDTFYTRAPVGRLCPTIRHSSACQRRAAWPARHALRVSAEQAGSPAAPSRPPQARPGPPPQRRSQPPQQPQPSNSGPPQQRSQGPPQQRSPQSSPGGPPQQRAPPPRTPGGPPAQRPASGPSGPSGPSAPGSRSPGGPPAQRPSRPSGPSGGYQRRPPGSFQQRPGGQASSRQPRDSRQGGRPKGPLINEDIRANEIRLIGGDKSMLGVMPLTRALDMADEEDADVILLSSDSDPPLCRLLPLDKFKFEQGKADREQKKKQRENRQDTKELKLRPGTEVHDYDVRVRSAQKFISKGDKVKVTVQFKGREMSFRDKSHDMMLQFVKDTGEEAIIVEQPKVQGRQMQMILGPKREG